MAEVNDTQSARQFLAENRQWQSELGSWEIDLLFCSRMLDIYGLKADSENLKKESTHLTRLVHDMLNVRLVEWKRQLKTNEEALHKLAEDQLLIKDRQMPFRQSDDQGEMERTRESVKTLQSQLYQFIEKMKSL